MEWYGRGPHECYPDRVYGAPLRRYRVPDAAQLHTPYIFPGQDSCNPLNLLLSVTFLHWVLEGRRSTSPCHISQEFGCLIKDVCCSASSIPATRCRVGG